MKKTSLLILLMLLLSSTSLFSLGVGAAWVFGPDDLSQGNGSAIFQISHEKIPGTILGISMAASNNNLSIGVVDDWWLYKQHLTGVLHLAMGPGVFATMNSYTDPDNSDNNSLSFNLGGRVAIDLRAFVMEPLELFFEYSPSVYVAGLGTDNLSFPEFNFAQFALGVRFWF